MGGLELQLEASLGKASRGSALTTLAGRWVRGPRQRAPSLRQQQRPGERSARETEAEPAEAKLYFRRASCRSCIKHERPPSGSLSPFAPLRKTPSSTNRVSLFLFGIGRNLALAGRGSRGSSLPGEEGERSLPRFCGGLSFCLGALRLFTGDIFLGRWVSVQSFPDVQKSPSFPPRREPSRSIFCRPSYSAWPAFPPPLRAGGPRCNERGARPADSGLLRDALPSPGRAVTHAGKADAAGPGSVATPAHIPERKTLGFHGFYFFLLWSL